MIIVNSRDALPRLPPAPALFLNLDAVLVQSGDSRLLGLLLALRGRFGGAVAIVTSHRLSTVDRLFAPVMLAGVGLLGAELRPCFNQPIQNTGGALPQALQKLMARLPFHGRIPVLAGDGNTDPAALLAAEQLGGLGIRLCAPARKLADLIAHHWLRDGVSTPREKRRAPRHKIPPALLGTSQLVRPLSV